MHYHTIVIGAGPAGLFAALHIAKNNKKVLLLEKNQSPGKKLLISGSGQCNFTHDGDLEAFFDKYGDKGKFLRKSFSVFDNQASMTFFESRGIPLEIRENQKVFPKSLKSQDILDVLLLECKKHNVDLGFQNEVCSIQKYDTMYTVETVAKKRYACDHVVIATGGKSYPHTGSTGDGYVFAKSFGHRIVEPKPALTYVTTHEKSYVPLAGISFPQASITLWRNNKKVLERKGSLLFTHKGLSGPVILDATRWIDPGDQISVNFMYPKSYEEVKKHFAETIPLLGKEQLITYLTKRQNLVKSFASIICQVAGVDETIPCARLTKEQREKVVLLLTKNLFNISGVGGLHAAMVTAGGVHLKEVNPTTMESRKQKGLYFIGEVLDIDGDTGGYNIQAAFSMGYLCAQHISKK